MKKRKIGALALSVALASAICVPATAFALTPGPDGTGTDGSSDLMATPAGTTELIGKIKATTLSVTVPTTMQFAIDPGTTQGVAQDATVAAKHGQFTSPTNYTVMNSSKVPVKVTVDSVTATGCALTDTQGNIAAKSTGVDPVVMVGLSDKANGASLVLGAATNWFTTGGSGLGIVPFGATDYSGGSTSVVAANTGKLAPSTATDGDNKATMYVFGAVAQDGWAEGDSFSVVPTLKVEAVSDLA